MKTTLNNLREELNAIADGLIQVNNFFWGDWIRAYREQDLNYPLMCCYITPTVTFDKVVSTVPIHIILCDRLLPDFNHNLNDVESDMLDLANQVYTIIKDAPRWKRIGSIVSCSLPTKFIDGSQDRVAGFEMIITFKVLNENCINSLPLQNYDINGDCD